MNIKCKIRIILTSQLGFLDLWGYNNNKKKEAVNIFASKFLFNLQVNLDRNGCFCRNVFPEHGWLDKEIATEKSSK